MYVKDINTITNWCTSAGKFECLSPDQNSYRSGDCVHVLNDIFEIDRDLILRMDGGWSLYIRGNIRSELIDNNLQIDNFQFVVSEFIDKVDRYSRRFDGTTETRIARTEYYDGRILFMPFDAFADRPNGIVRWVHAMSRWVTGK